MNRDEKIRRVSQKDWPEIVKSYVGACQMDLGDGLQVGFPYIDDFALNGDNCFINWQWTKKANINMNINLYNLNHQSYIYFYNFVVNGLDIYMFVDDETKYISKIYSKDCNFFSYKGILGVEFNIKLRKEEIKKGQFDYLEELSNKMKDDNISGIVALKTEEKMKEREIEKEETFISRAFSSPLVDGQIAPHIIQNMSNNK